MAFKDGNYKTSTVVREFEIAEKAILKNQLAIMCFLTYGREDERAKKVLEHRIKTTKELLLGYVAMEEAV
jgi:hypothetical protein